MGVFTYFLFLTVTMVPGLCLRALIGWLTAGWRPAGALSWQNVLGAILRALPFALTFAPTLLMKRGLGVLIPASLFLGGAMYERVFRGKVLDAEDGRNVSVASISLLVLWVLLAFIFFVQQSMAIDKKSEQE